MEIKPTKPNWKAIAEEYIIHEEWKPNPLSAGKTQLKDLILCDEFKNAFTKVCGVTRAGPDKCWILMQMAKMVQSVSGDVAEVGVYRGGTAKFLMELMPDRIFHLFDTFEGIPRVDENDDEELLGQFKYNSAVAVMAYLGSDKVIMNVGIFPETFCLPRRTLFSLVHLDVDTHYAVDAGLEIFYPLVNSGGAIIIDDYNSTYKGVKPAVDDFLKDKPENALQFVNWQAVIIKR